MARASAPRMECWDTLVEPEDTMLYLADARRIDGRVEDVPVTARYIDMAGAAYEHDSFDTHVRLGLLHMHQLRDEAHMSATAKNYGAAVRTRAEVKGMVAHVEKHQKQAWVFNPQSPAKVPPKPAEEREAEEPRPSKRALVTAPSILGSSRRASTVRDRLYAKRTQHQFGTGSAQVGATDIWTQGLRRSSNPAEERQRQLQRRQLALDPPQYLQRKPVPARRSAAGSLETSPASAPASSAGLGSTAPLGTRRNMAEDVVSSGPSTIDNLQPHPPISVPLADRVPSRHHYLTSSNELSEAAASSSSSLQQPQHASSSTPSPLTSRSSSDRTGINDQVAEVVAAEGAGSLLSLQCEEDAGGGAGPQAGSWSHTAPQLGDAPFDSGQLEAAPAGVEDNAMLHGIPSLPMDDPAYADEDFADLADRGAISPDPKLDAPSAAHSYSPVPPSSPRVGSPRASLMMTAPAGTLMSLFPSSMPLRPQSTSPHPQGSRPPSAGRAPRPDSPLTSRPDPALVAPVSLHMSMAGSAMPFAQALAHPARIVSSPAPLRPSSQHRARRSSWLGLESKLASTQPLFTALEGRPVSRSEARAPPSYTPQRRASSTGTSGTGTLLAGDGYTLPRRPSTSSSGAPPAPTQINTATTGTHQTPARSKHSVLSVMTLGITSPAAGSGLGSGAARSSHSSTAGRQLGSIAQKASPARRFSSVGYPEDTKPVPIKLISLE